MGVDMRFGVVDGRTDTGYYRFIGAGDHTDGLRAKLTAGQAAAIRKLPCVGRLTAPDMDYDMWADNLWLISYLGHKARQQIIDILCRGGG